jgi:cysteine-rich repeat protein
MRLGSVILGLLLVARGGAAMAFCGDGIPEIDEECDDGNTDGGDCCSPSCAFEPGGAPCPDDGNPCSADACDGAGTCQHPAGPMGVVCRPQVGDCDVAETCTGMDTVCPPDAKSTGECRAAAGACDVTESCDGVHDDCPADELRPAGVECRASAGACDPAEGCTGSDASCPPDAKSTAPCRAAAGICDVAESCDGVGNDCPADAVRPATVECRASAGACDPAEHCTGAGPACPPDAKSTAPCRVAAGGCDVAESCDGVSDDCPADARRPEGSECDDANACTRSDTCQSGTCAGTPIVCVALDGCHVPGTCDVGTGICSSPPKADNAACDDGNACTSADSCQAGVCRGLRVAGCCLVDAECADVVACTEDRCTGHACVHLPVDGRCGAPAECAGKVCAPGDAAADATGCVVRPVDESAYCAEDDDPCTIDACRAGLCEHEADGSGSRCPMLTVPFRTVLTLLDRARELQARLETAVAAGCSRVTPGACEVIPGEEPARLVTLLQATETDLQTAALAIAGRLAESSSPAAPRDPTVRATLALGLIANTPGDLRAFLATLRQARAHRVVGGPFARGRRTEAARLLRGTAKLRGQLQRVVARRRSFAR